MFLKGFLVISDPLKPAFEKTNVAKKNVNKSQKNHIVSAYRIEVFTWKMTMNERSTTRDLNATHVHLCNYLNFWYLLNPKWYWYQSFSDTCPWNWQPFKTLDARVNYKLLYIMWFKVQSRIFLQGYRNCKMFYPIEKPGNVSCKI